MKINTKTPPKNQAFSLVGLVVLLALVPLIAWSLNYMLSRDFTEPETMVKPIVSIATTTPVKTITSNPPSTATLTNVSASTASANVVTFTDAGFSPAKITMTRGDSVTFVNNSSQKMWVASNPFPTSSDYPDFNEKEGVASGGAWTFTFDQAGTWFYHNHYSPATGAKVIVSWK